MRRRQLLLKTVLGNQSRLQTKVDPPALPPAVPRQRRIVLSQSVPLLAAAMQLLFLEAGQWTDSGRPFQGVQSALVLSQQRLLTQLA